MKMKIIPGALVLLALSACSLWGCRGPAVSETAGQNWSSENQTEAAAEPTAGITPAQRRLETSPLGDTQASSPSPSIPSPSVTGALHVEGAKLCGSDGNPVQLKGISTHGLAWFPDYVNEKCFAQLKTQWDVNVIRLALYTAEYNGYCAGGDQNQLKALIHNGVRYATSQDMYVIIDWHILSDSNPNEHIDEARMFFDEMSRTYADHNNVLYEICNEPNGGTSWDDIKAYANTIIDIIRRNDKDGVIIVGTPNWSQYVDEAARSPVTGFDNIMYSLHFYAATHKDELRNKLTSAVQAGLPVFVTEYGICDASGSGGIDRAQAEQWINLMNQNQISYVAWNLSNKNETSAILNSSCAKTSGFLESDLSESGKWLHDMLTDKQLPASYESGEAETSPRSQRDQETEKNHETSSSAAADPGAGSDFSVTTDSFEITGKLVTQWLEQEHQVCQYTLTIRNISGSNCSGWSVELLLPGRFTLVNGWNGQYSARQNSLRITSMDYNRDISAGGTVSDIGFIIKFD